MFKINIYRINKIITQFLSYAKPIDLMLKPVNTKQYFEEIYRLFEDQAKQKGIKFVLYNTDSYIIKLDPDLIKQALMNIIQNAFSSKLLWNKR